MGATTHQAIPPPARDFAIAGAIDFRISLNKVSNLLQTNNGMWRNKEKSFVVSARLPIGADVDSLVKTFFVSVVPAEVTL